MDRALIRGGALLVASLLVFGCEARLAVGASCTRSGECSAPFVCETGRCRVECVDHRDCALGARCLRGADGLGRCTLDGDSCDETWPCETGLRCSGGECFDPCLGSSCPAGGMCRSGLCVPAALDGTDGGTLPPAYEPHRGCGSDADCRPDELCTRYRDGGFSCRRPCADHADCALGDTTSQCIDVTWGAMSLYACSVPCDPIGADGCPAGEACDAIEGVDPSRNPVDITECRPVADDRMQGEACTSGVPDPTLCAPGFSCDTFVASPVCRQLCITDGSGPPCPGGTVCTRDGWFVQLGGAVFGVCQ